MVSVEPQPDSTEEVEMRFGDRIELVDAAVGAGEGRAQLRVATYHMLASLSTQWSDEVAPAAFPGLRVAVDDHVRMTTLDRLISDYGKPDFCKVDVEGYELG